MSEQQNQQTAALGTAPVGPLLFRLALPTITAQVVNLLYSIVDRIYIGRIPLEGKLALTGMGVTFPVITLISAFAALIGMGGAPRASIALGAREHDRAERILGTCTAALWALALVLTALFLLFQAPLLRLFGASADTLPYAMQYLNLYVLGTVFVMTSLGLNGFITAQGRSSVAMKTVVIGAVLNTVLDPLFIFVLGLGVRGAALATVISQAVSAVWVMTFLTGKKTRWHLKRENLRVDAKIVLPCIALGLSPFVMQSTESLIAICFNSSLLRYGGDMAVGTMTVLTSIMQFSNMPLQGLTQGAQPIVSYNFGAKNAQRVRDAYFCLLRACFSYSMAIWLLVELFPRAFILIFNNDPALVEYAAWAVRIYMGCSGIFGIQIACQQTFVALGNAKTSLFLAVWRKIILLIPLIYILPHFFADKAFAVFLAEPVADFGAVALTSFTFYRQFRRSMRELEGAEATGER